MFSDNIEMTGKTWLGTARALIFQGAKVTKPHSMCKERAHESVSLHIQNAMSFFQAGLDFSFFSQSDSSATLATGSSPSFLLKEGSMSS